MIFKIQAANSKNYHFQKSVFFPAILASMLVSGCATMGQPEKGKTEQPLPAIPHAAPSSGKDVLDWITATSGKTRSLKGMAKVRIVSGQKETNAREIIVIKRPSSFRLETLGLMGSPAMIIATDGPRYTVQVPTENKVIVWDRSSSDTPIPVPFSLLETEEIAAIFLGGTPIIAYGTVDMTKSDLGKTYTLTLHSKDGFRKQQLVVDSETYQINSSEITDGYRGTVISLSYSNYQNLAGIMFPKKIEAQFLPRLDSVQINFEEIDINPKVDDDLFVLKPLSPK